MVELLHMFRRNMVYKGEIDGSYIVYPTQTPNVHSGKWTKLRFFENIAADIDNDIKLDKHNNLLPKRYCDCSYSAIKCELSN